MRFQRIFRARPTSMNLYDVPESARDGYGQPSTAGTAICAFYGTVRQLKGDEQLNVRQQWPTATHIVEARWLGSAIPAGTNRAQGLIVERMYLVVAIDGSRLNVLNANNPDRRNQFWRLICQERRNN